MSWLVPRRQTWYDLGLLLLRLQIAVVFIFHGSQKLFGAFGGSGMSGFTDMLSGMDVPMPAVAAWVSALTEFLGGILVGFGLLTRLVAIPMVINMVVAITFVHSHAFGLSNQPPGMEYALTLAIVLTALLIAGPGRWSIDGMISGECCRTRVD
jgi:putative oxidoreductase